MPLVTELSLTMSLQTCLLYHLPIFVPCLEHSKLGRRRVDTTTLTDMSHATDWLHMYSVKMAVYSFLCQHKQILLELQQPLRSVDSAFLIHITHVRRMIE